MSKKIKCPRCGKLFKDKLTMLNHMLDFFKPNDCKPWPKKKPVG